MEVDHNMHVWSVFSNYEYNFQYIRSKFPIVLFLNGHK
jgi:hypothetical protein